MHAFLISTAVIFVAELGDKSQLVALAFASRFRAWKVLVGVTLATAVVHLLSVGVGAIIGEALPLRWVQLLSGLSFLAFAVWTLRGDELDESPSITRAGWTVIPAIAATFFLSELGDKTMFATIVLASAEGWFGTWLGSTVGMVAADAVAIVVGAWLGARMPERAVRYGATGLFVLFGLFALFQALAG